MFTGIFLGLSVFTILLADKLFFPMCSAYRWRLQSNRYFGLFWLVFFSFFRAIKLLAES